MKKKYRILQFSAGFQLGDAITQEMISLDQTFVQSGYRTKIFSENINQPDRKLAQKFTKADVQDNDIFIYHHSIHSDVLPFLLKFPNRKILIYHNVTPKHYFEPYDLRFSYLLAEGRKDLSIIQEKFHDFFAVSEYNRQELLENGFQNVHLLPLSLNFSKWKKEGISKHNKDFLQFLFVGRIAPNKRQDDLIRFAKIWKEVTKRSFQFNLVGFCNPNQKSYLAELEFMIHTYELKDLVHIISFVDLQSLSRHYQESDYFISMSEHEGFCVPLMEAMYFNLPVFAYKAGAVEETLGGSGVLFTEKNFINLVENIVSLDSDQTKKNQLIEQQTNRLNQYLSIQHSKALIDLIENIK